MENLTLRNGRQMSVKWLVFVPMYTSAALAGLASASTLHAKNWDLWAWQAIVFGLIVLAVLLFFVMMPLLIVRGLLEKAEERPQA